MPSRPQPLANNPQLWQTLFRACQDFLRGQTGKPGQQAPSQTIIDWTPVIRVHKTVVRQLRSLIDIRYARSGQLQQREGKRCIACGCRGPRDELCELGDELRVIEHRFAKLLE